MAISKFAVVKINNQQYFATLDGNIEVDKIPGEPGEKVVFDQVLLVFEGDKVEIGTPVIEKMKVEAEIVAQEKGKKVRTFSYKAKSRYRKTHGQRSQITVLKINKIG
jgi:large subunit ribosomal protein L21